MFFSLALLPKYLKFRKSNYKIESGNSFISTVFDKGNYGEFLTFFYLENLDDFKRLLVNVYIPKDDGTTEIDLIMLSPMGIYVFESKNYSGWIFGNEKSQYWTQTLENKQKNKFFNPIWQNKGHITAFKDNLEKPEDSLFKSYIVFSERCELRKIELDSRDVKIIKRNDLMVKIKEDLKNSSIVLKPEEILNIYSKLKQYSNVDKSLKKEHIKNINLDN